MEGKFYEIAEICKSKAFYTVSGDMIAMSENSNDDLSPSAMRKRTPFFDSDSPLATSSTVKNGLMTMIVRGFSSIGILGKLRMWASGGRRYDLPASPRGSFSHDGLGSLPFDAREIQRAKRKREFTKASQESLARR